MIGDTLILSLERERTDSYKYSRHREPANLSVDMDIDTMDIRTAIENQKINAGSGNNELTVPPSPNRAKMMQSSKDFKSTEL